jgi:NDP-sugar pyrophosphorylase family protein
MNVINVCGGLSTRLGDITKDKPKVLLDIGPKAVLDWQLEKLKGLGVNEVVLAAGHLAHVLRNEVGDSRLGFDIFYAIEDTPLGTGGAIKHALKYLTQPDDPVLVINGDILTTIDLSNMMSYLKSDSDGIILGAKVDDASSYGTLKYDENFHLQEFVEKEGIEQSGVINGGYYLFNQGVHKYFPNKEKFSVEYDVFPNMKDLYVYESNKPWLDVGVPDRLEWARNNWQLFGS